MTIGNGNKSKTVYVGNNAKTVEISVPYIYL